ncbi:hypothetical protein EVAR_41408_1 [Eumeta japonica]|uniref:Uncharacterized protein n=1 Tax=Eumeta variegata TaxID=151549 RepID=A0A4C1W7D7_EUMVA|nr:hypothetical protein EVAR_41408_1 [Eumeta japonica]
MGAPSPPDPAHGAGVRVITLKGRSQQYFGFTTVHLYTTEESVDEYCDECALELKKNTRADLLRSRRTA